MGSSSGYQCSELLLELGIKFTIIEELLCLVSRTYHHSLSVPTNTTGVIGDFKKLYEPADDQFMNCL